MLSFASSQPTAEPSSLSIGNQHAPNDRVPEWVAKRLMSRSLTEKWRNWSVSSGRKIRINCCAFVGWLQHFLHCSLWFERVAWPAWSVGKKLTMVESVRNANQLTLGIPIRTLDWNSNSALSCARSIIMPESLVWCAGTSRIQSCSDRSSISRESSRCNNCTIIVWLLQWTLMLFDVWKMSEIVMSVLSSVRVIPHWLNHFPKTRLYFRSL
jgi:hypothetical protein